MQQWTLEYDGDGWFHIRNKQSALYLDATDATDGVTLVQNERTDAPSQLWRFIPEGAPLTFEAPSAPTGLVAQAYSASILLSWDGAEGMTYTLLRAGNDGKFITIARGLESTSLLDNSVYPSETYTYKVIAVDRSGNRSLCSSPVEAAPESTDALIARYPLSEDVNDHSGNRFTIKPFQNPTFRSGRTENSKALNLRGQQYMQLPHNLLDTERFSVALWLYVTSPAEGMHVLTTGSDSEHSLSLVTNQGGNMQLVCRNGANEHTLTAPAIPQRQWTHLAITADGSKVTLFVDGKEAASADMADAMPDHRLLTYLGRSHQAKQTYLVGYMQDVNIYNHTLTPESVIKDMEADYAGVESVATDKAATVIATEYYTLQGVRVAAPVADGVTIIRTIYSDGSSTVAKQLR